MLTCHSEFQKNDYEKLTNLCCVFLGRKGVAKLNQLGALHKLRWMEKFIYVTNLSLLENAAQQRYQDALQQRPKFPRLEDLFIIVPFFIAIQQLMHHTMM